MSELRRGLRKFGVPAAVATLLLAGCSGGSGGSEASRSFNPAIGGPVPYTKPGEVERTYQAGQSIDKVVGKVCDRLLADYMGGTARVAHGAMSAGLNDGDVRLIEPIGTTSLISADFAPTKKSQKTADQDSDCTDNIVVYNFSSPADRKQFRAGSHIDPPASVVRLNEPRMGMGHAEYRVVVANVGDKKPLPHADSLVAVSFSYVQHGETPQGNDTYLLTAPESRNVSGIVRYAERILNQ